jgi:hypothetical protein
LLTAEVHQLHFFLLTNAGNHDVVRLDIPMNHSNRVRCSQPFGDLRSQALHPANVQRSFVLDDLAYAFVHPHTPSL